jgi:hypothetical protein
LRNGELNTTFGVYRTLCCGKEIVLRDGDVFPDCPRHANLPTVWKSTADDAIPKACNLAETKKNNSAA